MPFFASMRADLTVHAHDRASYEAYVYGSAEVVGLMCVRAFLNEDRAARRPGASSPTRRRWRGARALGAAFQKINFLRDLGEDTEELGRTYFPGTTPGHLDAGAAHAILDEINADVAVARAALPELPRAGPVRGRRDARALPAAARRDRDAAAGVAAGGRVRLPTPAKLLVVGESVLAEARAGRAVDA